MPTSQSRKRATLKEVASAAGVSLASASYAVNGTGTLGDAMRARILKVAEELGYRQNLAAKTARTGKSNTLGLVIPDLSNPYFPNLVQGVIQRARHHGYTVFVMDVEETIDLERKAIEALVDRGADGLIWFPNRDENTAGSFLDNIPTVVIERAIPGLETIWTDTAAGGEMAAEHLRELGHRRIGIVSGPIDIRSMSDRCNAVAKRVSEFGDLVFQVENGYSMDLEPDVVRAIEEKDVTAIFAGGDMIAIGVIQKLQALGKRIPEDVSIVGMDDIPWAAFCSPPLTTVEIPIEELAIEAVDAIVRRIDTNVDTRRRVILDPKLIVRGSTMALPTPPR